MHVHSLIQTRGFTSDPKKMYILVLRLSEVLPDESHLYGCELFLSLAIAGGGEGSDEGWREADPCHETVDSRMGCVIR